MFLLYSHPATTLITRLTPNVGGGGGGWCGSHTKDDYSLWHQLSILQFNSILTRSTWRQCQIPQVRVQFRETAPLLATNQRFPWPLLPWIQLFARTAHKTQGNTFTSLLSNKGYDKWYRWIARWRDIEGKVWEGPECRSFCPRRVGMHQPPGMGRIHQSGHSPSAVLLEFL